MREVFLDYDAGREPKTKRFCCKCAKDLRPKAPARVVRVLEGMVLHPDDAGDQGERFLLGMDCAKLIGLEYSRPETPVDGEA